uniref:hypothetical protein n=1 Tax=Candidatus Enterovibrio escicola TaxID=1927127 RepID=UPI001237C1BF|nr:hypothetical protein [Candidatus Enterovibrio escacola]
MPAVIRLSYRFITTYAFSDIRFSQVPRSEEKERYCDSTVLNYTLLSMGKVYYLSQSDDE